MDEYDGIPDARLFSEIEDIRSLDPMVHGRTGSLAELRVSNFILKCPDHLEKMLGNTDSSITRRVPLCDPFHPNAGHAYLDRINYPDGTKATFLNMEEMGRGTYKFDSVTGKITHLCEGEERQLGMFRRQLLGNRLGRFAYAWDD